MASCFWTIVLVKVKQSHRHSFFFYPQPAWFFGNGAQPPCTFVEVLFRSHGAGVLPGAHKSGIEDRSQAAAGPGELYLDIIGDRANVRRLN